MANLRDLRKRRRGAANTRKITRTMELVASAKLRKAQEAAAASRPYSEGLRELVASLSAATAGSTSHPLMKAREAKRVRILVVTSDRGLCGAFNSNLVAKALERGKHHAERGAQVEYVAVGRKAASALSFHDIAPVATFSGVVGSSKYAHAEKVAQPQIDDFLAEKVDLVEVVYARFVSAARQVPDHYVMLPVGGESKGDAKGEAKGEATAPAQRIDFYYIPEPEELMAAIIPLTAKTAVFSALLQTSAAEHAARRVAMKNATDAAGDMVKALTGAYNRGRQGKITQEIAEIVGAVEAMA
jgi:F-type H+-transporting ATPase subunit gamma